MERHCLSFGPFRLNRANGTLLRDGQPVAVGQRGVRVLEALLQRPGEVLTKAELLDAAWPDAIVEEANLSVQIASLRKALGPAPAGGEWIATVPRVGYRFVPMAEIDGAGQGAADEDRARPLPARWATRPTVFRWAALAFAAVALAALAGFASLRPTAVPIGQTETVIASLAVLPFVDLTEDGGAGYLGDGVSDDIIAMLARVPDLKVVARNSSFAYRGQAVDIRKVGTELGATHVLEGSVRREADRLRIVAQLVDARTGKHVWAERFDRAGTDPWVLQDEVSEKIVAALSGQVGLLARQRYVEAWGKDSTSLREYDYYLRAFARLIQGTPEAHQRGEAIIAEGLARFPDSALLKSHAAGAAVWRFVRGWSDSPDPLEDFRVAGRLARETMEDPRASPLIRRVGHVVMAFVHLAEGRNEEAVVEAEAAIALAPYDGQLVYFLAEIPITAGRPQLALEWIERAAARYPPDDPVQAELAFVQAWAMLYDKGPEAALAILDEMRTRDPFLLRGMFMVRTIVLVHLGRIEDARAAMSRARELDPDWTVEKHRRRFFYVPAPRIDASANALVLAGLPEK